MSASVRQLRKRLDTALRALTQVECIANSAIEKHQGNTDLHWIVDGIADLAHYALEVAGEPPTAAELAGEGEQPVAGAPVEPADDTVPGDDRDRRNN